MSDNLWNQQNSHANEHHPSGNNGNGRPRTGNLLSGYREQQHNSNHRNNRDQGRITILLLQCYQPRDHQNIRLYHRTARVKYPHLHHIRLCHQLRYRNKCRRRCHRCPRDLRSKGQCSHLDSSKRDHSTGSRTRCRQCVAGPAGLPPYHPWIKTRWYSIGHLWRHPDHCRQRRQNQSSGNAHAPSALLCR